jgi:DNA polymerase
MWEFCFEKIGAPPLLIKNLRCSMAGCAVLALPRGLDSAAKVLCLQNKKDSAGHKIMMRICKPKKPSKKDPSTRITKDNNPGMYDQLYSYCRQDVDTEYGLIEQIPPLTSKELAIWQLDQQINYRGIACDKKTIENVLKIIDEKTESGCNRLSKITSGLVTAPGQTLRFLSYCKTRGVQIPNMQATTIKDYLVTRELPEDIRELLKIKYSLGMSSIKKFMAMKTRMGDGDRIRSHLVYSGARTRRWSSEGLQTQNMYRGVLKSDQEKKWCIDRINDLDLESIEMVYDGAFEVLASLTRSVITAKKGNELYCMDLAQIECRVLSWLAKDKKTLKAFGLVDEFPGVYPDVYQIQASEIYGVSPDRVTKDQRYIGKQARLGLGYGMGSDRFLRERESEGVELTKEFCDHVVYDIYRKNNPEIVSLWYGVEKATIRALEDWVKIEAHGCIFKREKEYLTIKIPSGGLLYYWFPRIKMTVRRGRDQKDLAYMGVTNPAKKWGLIDTYGGKIVENIVQALSRDILARAMINLKKAGFKLVMTVHDEVVAEQSKKIDQFEEFKEIFCSVPTWATGLPLASDGWRGERYRK